jgi:hypothetical protein
VLIAAQSAAGDVAAANRTRSSYGQVLAELGLSPDEPAVR